MRKFLAICAIAVLLVGCESSRFGEPCVGVLDQKKPNVEYELSVRNCVVGFFFSETIIVPGVVILSELECPRKPPSIDSDRKTLPLSK